MSKTKYKFEVLGYYWEDGAYRVTANVWEDGKCACLKKKIQLTTLTLPNRTTVKQAVNEYMCKQSA